MRICGPNSFVLAVGVIAAFGGGCSGNAPAPPHEEATSTQRQAIYDMCTPSILMVTINNCFANEDGPLSYTVNLPSQASVLVPPYVALAVGPSGFTNSSAQLTWWSSSNSPPGGDGSCLYNFDGTFNSCQAMSGPTPTVGSAIPSVKWVFETFQDCDGADEQALTGGARPAHRQRRARRWQPVHP